MHQRSMPGAERVSVLDRGVFVIASRYSGVARRPTFMVTVLTMHSAAHPGRAMQYYERCAAAAEQYGTPGDYVAGANIAGFVRVAEAMRAQGVV